MPDSTPMESELQVGRRHVFPGRGEYDVLAKNPYAMLAEDGVDLRWNSWVVAGVSGGRANECVVSSPHLGLCFVSLVDPGARPARARRFASFCGIATGTEKTGPDLSLRADGRTVTTRSRMESFLDNGEGAADHGAPCDMSVMWIDETFVETPPGEEDLYPTMIHLLLEPVTRGGR